jgi:flagellar biosynthesis protein FlhB
VAGEKTEKPTAKKRQEARKKGQAARSSELPQSISLVVAAVMLPAAVPDLMQRLGQVWAATFAPDAIRDAETVSATLGLLTWETIRVLLPLVIVVTVTSVVAQLALVGGKPNLYKLKPQWQGLNPKQGIKRLVGPQAAFELGKTSGKLLLVALVSWTMWDQALATALIGPTPLATSLPAMLSVLENLFVRVAALGVFFGLADALWNRYRFTKSLKMTKQELREEYKQQESNPLVKAEIRRRQQAMSRNRMIAAVATADVVITNPTHLAVALVYDADDPAPRVVAKGAGEIAARIREQARLHGVPIREDKPVARTLFKSVEIGDLVPVELYAAIAEILAAVYRARR